MGLEFGSPWLVAVVYEGTDLRLIHKDNVTGAGLERVRRAVRQVLCRLPVPATLLLLAACTPPADFEAARQPLVPGAYLDIKPLDEVLAVGGKPALTETDAAALQSRAAALQARAAALPATATDPETRDRLDAAIIANSP
jgi:hypothetical protein